MKIVFLFLDHYHDDEYYHYYCCCCCCYCYYYHHRSSSRSYSCWCWSLQHYPHYDDYCYDRRLMLNS